jgi:type I restriction enzyme M protein
MPRADRADYAFIQHMVKQLNDNGKMAVVTPNGILFRAHESKFREPMIEQDIVEGIIGLPSNLFQNNTIPVAILVVNKNKPKERKDEVLFLNADDESFYKKKSNQNELTQEGIKHIVYNFKLWKTEKKVSRVVKKHEIAVNVYNFNIALYIDTTEPEEEIDVKKELKKLKKLQKERKKIEKIIDKHMEILGFVD